MPCDITSVVSVEFLPQNEALLYKTIAGLQWSVRKLGPGHYVVTTANRKTIVVRNGIATGEPTDVNCLRVSYSQTLVGFAMSKAKQQGFGVTTPAANKVRISLKNQGGKL